MPEANCENSACNVEVADEKGYIEQWALVHKGELAGIYGSFETAWSEAAIRFHHRRCMVRQISAFPLTLSVSAENLQAESRLLLLSQKWIRFFARQLFPANEIPF
jgi:hypothetical protein